MADKKVNIQASTPVEKDFQQVHDIVVFHHSEVARKVNTEMLQMAWEIGQYISTCIKSAGWGAKVVDELSEYLQQQEPGSRGFGRRNLYNMVTFYDKYSTPEFCEIAKSLANSLFVQRKTKSEFGQMPSAQMEFAPLPSILTITTFSNHLEMRNDAGALWENLLMVERRKRQAYSGKFVQKYFWRTIKQQEIDLIEECDGQISAFEYKWKAGKVARLPLPFSEAYPDATFQTITPDNYQEFV